jgi:two-component system NarL family sensor kinase
VTNGSESIGAVGTPSVPAAQPHVPPPSAPWVTVADGRRGPVLADRPVRMRRIFFQVIAAAATVLVLVAVVGLFASRDVAERQSVNDAAQTTDLFAESVVQPAIQDGLLTGSPTALARLDKAVQTSVLGPRVVRVKIWTTVGKIIYSDEPRILGKTFALGQEERSVLVAPTTHAEVSDLTRPENRYEKGRGKLLEVYRPVWTPSGTPLLFETYLPYDTVTARTGELWRGFAGITLTSLLLLITLMLPILWRLLDRVNTAQDQRVALLEHAVNASSDERRRIAATLHDGVVQELAAASFAVAGAAERAATDGRRDLADILRNAASAVRGTIGGLRSLLVDIYPASLRTAGLAAALTDLAGTVRTRDIDVRLTLPANPRTGLDEEQERLVYRVAQESLRNTARHAAASKVDIALVTADQAVSFSVCDDGVGFDVEAARTRPPDGHFGLQVMSDLAEQSGALLEVCSLPGEGTCWRLTVPRP